MKQIETAIIIGKKWFDKVNGNTYHTARIIINGGEADIKSPRQYGYGNSYITTAAEIALENDYTRDNMTRERLREWLTASAIIDETSVTRRRDL